MSDGRAKVELHVRVNLDVAGKDAPCANDGPFSKLNRSPSYDGRMDDRRVTGFLGQGVANAPASRRIAYRQYHFRTGGIELRSGKDGKAADCAVPPYLVGFKKRRNSIA